MKTLAKIYVSTYHKYNCGSLSGAWIKLPMTETGLDKILRKIAGSERDPEYMIQDTEIATGLDFRSIGESEDIHRLNRELADLRFERDMLTKSPAVLAAIDEHKKVWPTDKHMVEYCAGRISDAYMTEAGDIVEFHIPTIETHFCFAEDYNGAYDAKQSVWAQKMAYDVSRTEAYFIRENMAKFRDYEKIFADGNACGLRVCPCSCAPLKLVEIVSRDYFPRFASEAERKVDFTAADIAGLQAMIESEKAKFLVRLRKWWKRYGADGLRTWTYYSD